MDSATAHCGDKPCPTPLRALRKQLLDDAGCDWPELLQLHPRVNLCPHAGIAARKPEASRIEDSTSSLTSCYNTLRTKD